ncbi:MAG: HEAT repeat domain-containing protein [Planctomycetes bacterium]|nr:HEAT repeat domain-containing protein [Planctomycetota bacterium]
MTHRRTWTLAVGWGVAVALAGCQTPAGGGASRASGAPGRGSNASGVTDPQRWAAEKRRAGAVEKMEWADDNDFYSNTAIATAEEMKSEFRRVPDLLLRFEGGSSSQWAAARRELRDIGNVLHPQIRAHLDRSESANPAEATEARAWLARIGRIFALVYRFNERSPATWEAARRALVKMGDDATGAAIETLLMKFRRNDHEMWGWARQQLVQIGARVAEPTYYILVSEKVDRLARIECAKTLADLGTAGESWLTKSLEAKDWRVRYAVAAALGEEPRSRATLPVLQHLLEHDSEWQVRGEAAASLSRLKEPATAPALLKGMSDPDPLVQRNCIEGLGILKEKRAVEPLVQVFDRAEDQRVTQMACWALYRISGRKFGQDLRTADLKAAVYDPEGWKRWWASGRSRGTP